MNKRVLFDDKLQMTRRRALAWVGGLGLAAFVPGCGEESSSGEPAPAASTTTAETTTAVGATTPDCVLSPELTEGPFYLDLDLVRSDITEDRPGLPLELQVNIVDADACEPIKDAAVDLWHCDANGDYSGVEGGEGTFLRGVQMTNAAGAATFRTIYPGWYMGRAVHIHVKVAPSGSEAYTGQLFFEDDVTAAAYRSEPYTARPGPDMANADDGIYNQGGSRTIIAVTTGDKAYSGVVTLGVLRA